MQNLEGSQILQFPDITEFTISCSTEYFMLLMKPLFGADAKRLHNSLMAKSKNGCYFKHNDFYDDVYGIVVILHYYHRCNTSLLPCLVLEIGCKTHNSVQFIEQMAGSAPSMNHFRFAE